MNDLIEIYKCGGEEEDGEVNLSFDE